MSRGFGVTIDCACLLGPDERSRRQRVLPRLTARPAMIGGDGRKVSGSDAACPHARPPRPPSGSSEMFGSRPRLRPRHW